MKKDDVIINAITELGICTKSEYKDFIDETLEDIKSDPGSKSDYVKLITYVDSKGIICGRELEVYEDRDKVEDFELYYVAARDGDNIALDVLFQVDDDSFSIELNGKEKSKDTYSGNIKLEVESSDYWSDNIETYSFNIKFDGFNIANEEKGYINGKFSVDLIVTKFEVEFKSDGKSQEISFEIPDYATIKFTYSESKPDDIKMPSSKDKIYDVENEDDILKLMEEIDFEAFIEKLSEDLDFDLSLIGDLLFGVTMIMTMIMMTMIMMTMIMTIIMMTMIMTMTIMNILISIIILTN